MQTITLDSPVPAEHQPEVLRQLRWLAVGAEDAAFDTADGRILRFRLSRTTVTSEAAEIHSAIARLAATCRAAPSKTVYETGYVANGGEGDAYRELVRRGWVVPGAAGTHIYAGGMSELYHALDAEFRRRALALGVQECKFPSLIDTGTLLQAGYFDSFAHHANLVCHLPEHADAVRKFRDAVGSARPDQSGVELTHLLQCDCSASPTVCYHFYRLNEGCTLYNPVRGATALSPCYRFEGDATSGLHRLREFNMREIIFIGDPEAIAERRETLLDCMKGLLDQCGLAARMQTASDPFFVDDSDRKRLFQMSFDLKHEAQAHLPGHDEWLAIGSINLHLDHFGRLFGIKTADGRVAHSCCLGFGLDRWCLAIFEQHGLSEHAWPAGLQTIVRRYGMDCTELQSKEVMPCQR